MALTVSVCEHKTSNLILDIPCLAQLVDQACFLAEPGSCLRSEDHLKLRVSAVPGGQTGAEGLSHGGASSSLGAAG
jgi:hypothetical protein